MISQVNIYVMDIVWIFDVYVWRSKFSRGSYCFVKAFLRIFVTCFPYQSPHWEEFTPHPLLLFRKPKLLNAGGPLQLVQLVFLEVNCFHKTHISLWSFLSVNILYVVVLLSTLSNFSTMFKNTG